MVELDKGVTTKVHTLGVGQTDIAEVRQFVFDHLLQLTDGVVKSYRSDLYHDAMWLREYLTEPMAFYFSVGECGTHIGTDEALSRYREHVYRCTVAVSDRRRWTLTLTGV